MKFKSIALIIYLHLYNALLNMKCILMNYTLPSLENETHNVII